MQVRHQRIHPAPQAVYGVDDGLLAFPQLCLVFDVVQYLGGSPDTGQGIADVMRDDGYQAAQGSLSLMFDQGIPAGFQFTGHPVDGTGQFRDLIHTLLRDLVVETAAADLRSACHDRSHRPDKAVTNDTAGEYYNYDCHQEHDGDKDRRVAGPQFNGLLQFLQLLCI